MFGTTTDVGKTIVSAGLLRAAIAHKRKVCYIKPIQTGKEPDEYFVQFYADPKGSNDLICRTIHHWMPATSPHIAAKLVSHDENDDELVRRLKNEIGVFEKAAAVKDTWTIVECAGGVCSPGPSGSLQADVYRRLRLPVVLVADAKLGGITSTISAIESLRLRGYTLHAVVVIETDDCALHGNASFIQGHLDKSFCGIPGDSKISPHWSDGISPKVFSLSSLPAARPLLHTWYQENDPIFLQVLWRIVSPCL